MPKATKGRRLDGKLSPLVVEGRLRMIEAANLRRMRVSFQDIADRLGYANRGTAYHAVETILKELPAPAAEEMRAEQGEVIDAVVMNMWPSLLRGDAEAGRVIIRAEERRAKLFGLDLTRPGDIIIDARTQTLALEAATSVSAGGIVDAYTFATHEDYCNLDLSDKPMQQIILNEFMSPTAGYTELDDICGMRSGKGTIGSVIVWYKMYRLLMMSNPQKYYGLTQGQTISTLNMGTGRKQAKDNVFKHCKDRLNHGGKWFQEIRAGCADTGEEIKLPKDLAMRSGNSSTGGNVGSSNIAVVFDEISKYKTNDGKDNAEDVYTKIKATTATFGPDAVILAISSPEWERDFGMRLLQQALEYDDMPIHERCDSCRPMAEAPGFVGEHKKSHPRMFGIHMATWDANTARTRDQLWDEQNGAANPRAFSRDFGARPVGSEETYYPDPERWDRQHTAALVAAGVLVADPLRYPYNDRGELAEWFRPCCDSRRYVHIDLGLTRDACGLAMAHQSVPGCMWFETVDGKPSPIARRIVLDVVVQVKPPKAQMGEARGEISFDRILARVRDWRDRGYGIVTVSTDGFQGLVTRQLFRSEGFRTELISVDRTLEPHDTLQEMINTDSLAYGFHPVLVSEGKALLLKNGRKVDHPDGGSKDVVDAAAGAVWQAAKKGGRKRFIGGSTATAPPTNGVTIEGTLV